MKAFSGVFAKEVIRRHLHKLVQVPVKVSTFRSSLSPSFSFFFLVKNIYIDIYGRVYVVPYDDLGGRKFETEEEADICHE